MRIVAIAFTSVVVAAGLAGPAAAGLAPSGVKTTSANEQIPAASTGWFVWTQSPPAHPTRTNVRAEAMPIGSSTPFRVNAPDTHAWNGGVEGDRLVYQEIDSGDSDIRLHNLATDQALANEPINTDRWEWHPTISRDSDGDTWIMFGRQNTSTWVQRVFAYNVATGRLRVLQETTNRRYWLVPGQVNGDWATWTACKPNCEVRYVNLLDGSPRGTVPRPSYVRHQYGSSVAEDGTVYYARSGNGCGANVKLMRRRAAGATRVLVDFPDRRDVSITYTADENAFSPNEVYYDRVGCGSGAWNIYKFVD